MGIATMVIGVLVALEVIVTVTAIDAVTTGTDTAFIAPIMILIALSFQSFITHPFGQSYKTSLFAKAYMSTHMCFKLHLRTNLNI